MGTNAFDESDSRSNQADWLELMVLCNPRSEMSSSALLRVLGLIEEFAEHGVVRDDDAEDLFDEEILEPGANSLLDQIWGELRYRSEALGEAYPFDLEPVGEGFIVKVKGAGDSSARSARRNYVACLLITAARRPLIAQATPNDALGGLQRGSARVMQILAVKSAAHFTAGDAYWFGWPRIDEAKAYRAALERLVSVLGHGKLKVEPPAWSDNHEKDGTVDVVAWRSFPDRTYGSLVVYGQVASGLNWRSKPIKAFIDGYFHDWFEDNPAMHWLPAMFIPYTLHADATETAEKGLARVVEAYARREESVYGIVFDRIRIASLSYIDEAESCACDAQHMHRHAELDAEIDEWVEAVRVYASS